MTTVLILAAPFVLMAVVLAVVSRKARRQWQGRSKRRARQYADTKSTRP